MNLEILSTPELERMWQREADPRKARRLQEEIEARQLHVAASGTLPLFGEEKRNLEARKP